jgi:hypothetical protein
MIAAIRVIAEHLADEIGKTAFDDRVLRALAGPPGKLYAPKGIGGQTPMPDDYAELEQAMIDCRDYPYNLETRARLARARGNVDIDSPLYFEIVFRVWAQATGPLQAS